MKIAKANVFDLCRAIGFSPRVACEVGVYYPDNCRLANFDGQRILVEPLPEAAEALRQAYPKATIHQCAVGPRRERALLKTAGQCSHLGELSIYPNEVYQHDEGEITVQCVPFSDIDPGNIDVLLVDTEGAEWHVLETMRSRPRVIVMEMHNPGFRYQNPHHGLILMWMRSMNYCLVRIANADCYWLRDITP